MASLWDFVANWVQVPSLPTGLSTSLQQRVTRFILRSVVGRFVQGGGDLNSTEGADGDTVLTDLTLNADSINLLLPDAVPQLESGSVAQVILRLPWSSLYNGAIRVRVKGVRLSTAIRPEKMDEATLYTSAMRASENLSELEESITQLAAEAIHADPDGRDIERSLSLEEGGQFPMSGAWTEGTRESFTGRVVLGALTRMLLRRLQVSVEDTRASLAFGNEHIHANIPNMSLNTDMDDITRVPEEQASLEDALCTVSIRGLSIELETPKPRDNLDSAQPGLDVSTLRASTSTYKSVYQSAILPSSSDAQPCVRTIAACGNAPISIGLEAKKSNAGENILSMDVRMPTCTVVTGPESLAAVRRLYESLNTLGTALEKPSSLPQRHDGALSLSVYLGKVQIACLYEEDQDIGTWADPKDAPLSGQHFWLEASDSVLALGSHSVRGSIDYLGIYERSPESTSPVLIFRHFLDIGVQDAPESKPPLEEATFEDPWASKDATGFAPAGPVINLHWDRRLPPQVKVQPIQLCAKTSTLERLLVLWHTVLSSSDFDEEESDTSSFSEVSETPSWPALDVHVEHVRIALRVQQTEGHMRSGTFSFALHHILCELGHREAEARNHICLSRFTVQGMEVMHIPSEESIGYIFFKLSDSAKHGKPRSALSLSALARPLTSGGWQPFVHVSLGELDLSLNRQVISALQYLAEDALELAARWKKRFTEGESSLEVPAEQDAWSTEPYSVMSMDIHRIQVHMMLPVTHRYLYARASLLSLSFKLDDRKAWSLHLSTQSLTLDEPKAQLTYFSDNGTRKRDAPVFRLDLAPESQRGATGPRLFLNLTGCILHLVPDGLLWQDAAVLLQVPEGVFVDLAPSELTRVTCVVRDVKFTIQVPGDDTQALLYADAVSLLLELAASGRTTVSVQLSEAVTKLISADASKGLPWKLLTARDVRANLACDGGEHPTMDLDVSRSRLHLRLSAATCETVHRLFTAAQEHLAKTKTPVQDAVSNSGLTQDTKANVLQDIDEDAFCEPLATSLEEITGHTESSSGVLPKPSEESPSLDAFPYVVAEGRPLLESDNVTLRILNGSNMTPTFRMVQSHTRETNTRAAPLSIHTDDTRISLELFDDQDTATAPLVQVQAVGVEVKFSAFGETSPVVARTHLKVQELEIFDKLPTSTWNKFLTRSLETPVPQHWRAPMASVVLQHMRSVHGTEVRLKAKLAPLRMFVDQDTLDFLEQFGLKATASMRGSQLSANGGRPEPFVQYAEVHPVYLVLDYKPKRVNYARIQQGSSMELLNLFNFEASAMVLRHVTFYGVDGWTQLFYALDAVWSPDVKANQLADIVSGVTPVQTLVNFGAGLTNLVLLPFEQYERDQSLVRGLRRGTTGLVYSTALETVKLGVKLSTGTQVLLERAEHMLGGQLPGPIRTEVLGEDGAEPAPLFSKRAQPPESFWDGARQARSGFSRGIHDASDTILAVPTSVTEPGEDGRPRTLVRAVPIALLQGASGATEATSRLFMGMQTALDPRAPSRSRIKYKPPGEE